MKVIGQVNESLTNASEGPSETYVHQSAMMAVSRASHRRRKASRKAFGPSRPTGERLSFKS